MSHDYLTTKMAAIVLGLCIDSDSKVISDDRGITLISLITLYAKSYNYRCHFLLCDIIADKVYSPSFTHQLLW